MLKKSAAIFTAGFLLVICLGLVWLQPARADTSSISGRVFIDSNEDGVSDPGESGVAGAEITLVSINGGSESILSQAKTREDGTYRFDGLARGQYYIQSALPADLYYAVAPERDLFTLPAQGGKSRSVEFSLARDESLTRDISAGKRSAYINIVAFGDKNMNGGRLSSEPLLRGVEIEVLYEHEGKFFVIAQGSTDREGTLQIRELTPASYRLRATLPDPYIVGPLGSKMNPFYNVIMPGENNIGISDTFELDRSIGLGVGGVMAGSLSGSVWFDSNMDGWMDSGEGGQEGILLTLTHLGMNVTRTLTTAKDAAFSFTHLQAGEYSISASLPDGMMFALPGSASVFTAGYSGSEAVNIHVSEGQDTALDPIGVMPASGIRLIAFHDSNVNGKADEGEPAFANAKAEVLSGETVVASAVTDSQGIADFPRIRSGSHTIRVSLPDGQIFTVGDSDGNAFSSPSAASVLSVQRELKNGELVSLYAGATIKASASGLLFEDANLNSVMDPGENGMGAFTVQAINEQGEVAAETATQQDGSFLLDALVPSSYHLRFLLVSPYVFSQPSASDQGRVNRVTSQTAAYGETDTVQFTPGAAQEGLDAGAFRSAVINGAVLLGDDELGFEGQLGGLEGVLVELTDENGQAISEHTKATTDANGAFSLKGALPGQYLLSYALPGDSKFSRPLTGESLVYSEAFEVKSSDVLTAEPLYAVKTGILSGAAFHDANASGLRDSDEPGLAGAALKLKNLRTAEVYETQSGLDGLYRIEGVRPGNYEATITLPEGYVLDANEASLVPASLNGISSKEHAIAMGARIENGLLPALKPLTLSGTVYYDNNLDLKYDPQVDKPHSLQFSLTHKRSGYKAALNAGPDGSVIAQPMFPGDYQLEMNLPGDHLLTSPQGAVSAQGVWTAQMRFDESNTAVNLALVQLGSLSGAVWNMDGSQADAAGLAIRLLDESGKQLQEAISDAQGRYHFDGLLPVQYQLSVQLPELYRFARQVDTASRPSVILSDTPGNEDSFGKSGPIRLGMGERKAGQDIGMGAMGKLGDYAWLDMDRDGMQDAGEPGIPGIAVSLFQYGELSAETTTDNYGRYLFSNLFPGEYLLQAEMPAELMPTIKQSEFPLVASVLIPSEGQAAQAENIIVPSGGRNLNADLGFVLRREGEYPANLLNLPQKDWTRVNQQNPRR